MIINAVLHLLFRGRLDGLIGPVPTGLVETVVTQRCVRHAEILRSTLVNPLLLRAVFAAERVLLDEVLSVLVIQTRVGRADDVVDSDLKGGFT